MKLPRRSFSLATNTGLSADEWKVLTRDAGSLASSAGRGDAFREAVDALRELARQPDPDAIREVLRTRVGARALTWQWCEDPEAVSALLSPTVLDLLIEAQAPRLTRLTLLNLFRFYFEWFDELDELNNACRKGLRNRLEDHLRAQLRSLPERRQVAGGPDPLDSIRKEGEWLLSLEGPLKLAAQVRDAGGELARRFEELGLAGMDGGRYADICRAHFYLETLRRLPIGAHDPVFDELLKSDVNRAPYEKDRRIGHAALEILIDRAGDTPPEEPWQGFILALAGDPRIASSAASFRDWWRPLGDARIERVRNWLSREDLRLFLRAVEEYGKDTRNTDLQRMFPARQVFLEGLYDQGVIRASRLMLGADAESTIRRLLGKDLSTSFVRLENMADKAVIYLDCGDFHIVEGSHSFKIWTYLERPSPSLTSYDVQRLSHSDLTKRIPKEYQAAHPGLEHSAVTHTAKSLWQRHVFEFLAANGVEVDIEQMLTRDGYRRYLDEYGLPIVSSGRRPAGARSRSRQAQRTTSAGRPGQRPRARPHVGSEDDLVAAFRGLGATAKRILRHLERNPGDKARYVANVLRLAPKVVNQNLHGDLAPFCDQDEASGWSLTKAATTALRRIGE